MLALRPTMPGKRVRPSGPNIPDAERHTVKFTARVSPELAASVRALCAAKGITLAQIIAAGVESIAASVPLPPGTNAKELDAQIRLSNEIIAEVIAEEKAAIDDEIVEDDVADEAVALALFDGLAWCELSLEAQKEYLKQARAWLKKR
jgi:hypothetical protein